MAEKQKSKITILFNWLSEHPKTLRYLADNPSILKHIAKYGDNIDAIIRLFSQDAEKPINVSQITGIGLNLRDFWKYGLGFGIGFILGRKSDNQDDE